MFLDNYQLPASRDDVMDSCVRISIISLQGGHDEQVNLYEKDGYVYRHPYTAHANNKWNCTPDQIKMWLMATKDVKAVRRVFWRHVQRLGFSQDFQRDAVGTWKYPWPHKMTGGDPVDEGKWRMFDFATPTLPAQWGMMIIKGRFILLYPLLIFCILFHFFGLLLTNITKPFEVNQLFAESVVYKTIWFFNHLKWVPISYEYWGVRDEPEYHTIILKTVKGGQ